MMKQATKVNFTHYKEQVPLAIKKNKLYTHEI